MLWLQVTVLKNLTNLFVIAGDIIVFGRRYNLGERALLSYQPCVLGMHCQNAFDHAVTESELMIALWPAGVWATLVLMTASALCAAATDLQFNAMGYMWQLINCSFTAAYSLVLRNVMDRVGQCDWPNVGHVCCPSGGEMHRTSAACCCVCSHRLL